MKFYRCNHCGNLVLVMNDGGVTPVCCGENMELLKANAADGAAEKHVPIVEHNENQITIKVGSAPHPMTTEHYIQWICLTDGQKILIHKLSPNDEPSAHFTNADLDATKLTAFAYCNLHGLWQNA